MVGSSWFVQKSVKAVTRIFNTKTNMKQPSHSLHAGEPTTSSTRRRSCAQCRATALSPMKRAPEV